MITRVPSSHQPSSLGRAPDGTHQGNLVIRFSAERIVDPSPLSGKDRRAAERSVWLCHIRAASEFGSGPVTDSCCFDVGIALLKQAAIPAAGRLS